MNRTKLFDSKHLKACCELQGFLHSKGIDTFIYSDYVTVSKLDIQPTEFFYLQYPQEVELLIEYWTSTNKIIFFKGDNA